MKEQITSEIDKYLLPLISSKKSYNTQHIITHMVEDWREKLDKDFSRGGGSPYRSFKGFWQYST